MSLLQMKLNQDLPFGRVFQGTGEQDPKDTGVKFYQHGLYFLANGDLAVTSPHNAAKMKLIESLGGINPESPPAQVQAPDRTPVNPEIIAKLSDKDDAEVFAIAGRLIEALGEEKIVVDYVPVEENREDNIRFIAKHTS